MAPGYLLVPPYAKVFTGVHVPVFPVPVFPVLVTPNCHRFSKTVSPFPPTSRPLSLHISKLRNEGLALAPLAGRFSGGRGGGTAFCTSGDSRLSGRPSRETGGLPRGAEKGVR
jgi:hypothetical protein